MAQEPIQRYTLTLECNGRVKTAHVTHDLYGTGDNRHAVKDLQDALMRLMVLFGVEDGV